MDTEAPADIGRLLDELDAAERDAHALVAGLSEDQGTWRAEAGSWSVAECLDHLATANRVYVGAMREPAEQALQRGSRGQRAVRPGWVGGLFVRSLEPPAKRWSRSKAPRKIRPRAGPPLGGAFDAFRASQAEIRAFLRAYAGIDLAGVRFHNPFVRGIRFSLATGLHVITAHERRHLWQAWRVRRAMEDATVRTPASVRPPGSRDTP